MNISYSINNIQYEENNQFDGLVGRAIALVNFEPIYGDVFAYVFGET